MTDDEISSIDLEDTFFLHQHPSKLYRLKLSPSLVSIRRIAPNIDNPNEYDQESIPLDDLYGCLFMKVKQNPNHCHLIFYVYTFKRSKRPNGTLSNKGRLERSEHIFTYGQYDNFQSNLTEVTRWHRAVTHAMYLRRRLPSNRSSSSSS